MEPIEIVVIIAAVAIVGGVIGRYIYKKYKHLPTGECARSRARMKRFFKQIEKEEACEHCKDKNK